MIVLIGKYLLYPENGQIRSRIVEDGKTIPVTFHDDMKKAVAWARGMVRTDSAIAAFYARPQDEISRDLVLQAQDNSARGWTND